MQGIIAVKYGMDYNITLPLMINNFNFPLRDEQ